jgi:hypothetical protein
MHTNVKKLKNWFKFYAFLKSTLVNTVQQSTAFPSKNKDPKHIRSHFHVKIQWDLQI